MGPRTTKITRERTGCLTCRARKKKCEQQRPICRGCERNGFLCEWPVINRVPQRQKKTSNRNTTSRCMGQCQSGSSSSQEPQLTDLEMEVPSPDVSMVLLAQDTPSTCDDSDAPAASDSPDSNPSTELSETPIRTEISTIFDGSRLALSKTFSPSETGRVWELCGEDGFHLLGHYLTRTSITMSGGFQKENPFLSHVMPMALSSDLVMQLVLTVSAMHRAVAMPADLAVRSQSYYHEALARFRNAIGDYIHDGGAKRMALAVGSLVLCFTETVRGDRDGAIFMHLKAADNLVSAVLDRPLAQQSALEDFLVEFYIYVSTLSLVSMDPKLSQQFTINPKIEARAHVLIRDCYIGSLCGSWLNLLLLIPKITRFILETGSWESLPPNLLMENFVTFATIQADVLSWTTCENSTSSLKFSGLLYQQAILLLLYTGVFKSSPSGTNSDLINSTIQRALSCMAEIPATDQTNTLLCWPIAVIGSCARDHSQRELIRQRLEILNGLLSLGNIDDIIEMLDILWSEESEELGPWRIYSTMQSNSMCFSFA